MYVQGVRKDKTLYIPEYVESVSVEKCLGCGRCYKVCSHGVYDLVDRGDLDLDDDDYEEEGAMVMVLANPGNCVGCKACGKVCSRKCHVFEPMAV